MPELADSLDATAFGALAEGDRSLYVKGENDTYSLHPAIAAERTALKSKNSQLKTEKQQAADRAKVLDELGLDGDALKAVVAAHKKAEEDKLSADEKQQRKEQAMQTAHDNALKAVKDTAEKEQTFLRGQLRKHMIDSVASLALEKAGLIEGGLEVALPHIVSALDMVEEGDGDERTLVTRVIGPDKQARYSGANFMTPDELVEELKKKPGFMGIFKATGKGGSGAPAQTANRNTTQRTSSEMTTTEKISAGLTQRR